MTFISRGFVSKKLVQNALNHGKRKVPAAVTARLQSTSTMDLVSMEESYHRKGCIFSTLQFGSEQRDFSALARHSHQEDNQTHWEALLTVAAEHVHHNDTIVPRVSVAEEMDLVQAAERRHLFDKILLLLNHGQHIDQFLEEENIVLTEEEEEEVETDALTGKGVGQALTLARRTAAFCNGETGLVPDLFVLEPSRKAVQTAFLSFPYDTPHSSLRKTKWVCHPGAIGNDMEDAVPAAELEREFLGIDCSMLEKKEISHAQSTDDLLDNSEDLVSWLAERDERIIVVSGDKEWLQALGCTINYKGAQTLFANAEMRAIGICFD